MWDSPDARQFVTTHWSLVLAAGGQSSPGSRQALETLCRLYWYPLYAYVRRRGYSADEALDLTQGFFARILEKNAVASADPGRGKFRSYLLGALKHFLANEWDRASAQKRGGGCDTLSIDGPEAEGRYRHEPADDITPQKLFERRWVLTLLDLALQELREEFARQDRERIFDRLKGFLGGERPGVPYARVAAELDMTEAAVKVAVHRLRRRYRQLLRNQIAQTVGSSAEIDEEIQQLFAVLSG